jgi:predicted metal-dependent phosphoesterase TrpH
MQREFRADLHCHTTCSDGSDTPIELLQKAAELSLNGLSITDHDTIDAYTPELFAKAGELNIQILPGIEISSQFENTTVHILGYGIDIYEDVFHEFLREIAISRNERNRAILEKLSKKGMRISEEELAAYAPKRTVGRPHIAELLMKKGYVPSVKDAFFLYLRESACCYVSGFKQTPREVIEKIHQAKGKAVLAHPHFFKKQTFVKKLLELPFDGLECYYSLLRKEVEAPWVKIAKEKKLIATGGSDYHGALKPQAPLGCSWVGKETFEALCSSQNDRQY